MPAAVSCYSVGRLEPTRQSPGPPPPPPSRGAYSGPDPRLAGAPEVSWPAQAAGNRTAPSRGVGRQYQVHNFPCGWALWGPVREGSPGAAYRARAEAALLDGRGRGVGRQGPGPVPPWQCAFDLLLPNVKILTPGPKDGGGSGRCALRTFSSWRQ